jgi:hypothetical protein
MQRDRRLSMIRAVVSDNNPYRDLVLLGQLPHDVPGRSPIAIPDRHDHAPARLVWAREFNTVCSRAR